MTQRAFTLVELMVSTALAALLFSAVFTGALTLSRSMADAARATKLYDSQSRVLDYLLRDVRGATGLKVDTGGTRLVIQVPAPYEDRYAMPTPSAATTTGVTYGTGSIQITYQTTNGYFRRTTSTGASQNLAQITNGFGVTFSPATLTGTSAPPVTATVEFRATSRSTSVPAGTRLSASLQSRLNATILP